jgi:tetratricopeptide (TPR) repeat protein
MRVMLRLIAVVALFAFNPTHATPDRDMCLTSEFGTDPAAEALCERVYAETHDDAVAAAGARIALNTNNYAALEQWGKVAPRNLDGARIYHFVGQGRWNQNDLAGAEEPWHRALDLRKDVAPLKASNTALALLALVRSTHPAPESIDLAYLAWDQAKRAGDSEGKAMAAGELAAVLIDIGELKTAELVIDENLTKESPVQLALARGRVATARGLLETATSNFRTASQTVPKVFETSSVLEARIELVRALLATNQVASAAHELAGAEHLVATEDAAMSGLTTDVACRLVAAQASVALARGDAPGALAFVDRGLELHSRDGARVLLLGVRGDALARSGDWRGAERAWRAAADEIDTWRASISTLGSRTGLIAAHRHVLESWLDSSAQRGDAEAAAEVTQRIVGRGVFDRLYQREAGGRDVPELERRLAQRAELKKLTASAPTRGLASAPHDFTALVSGARAVWAIQHRASGVVVTRVGDRDAVITAVDAYRKSPDDRAISERLGGMLFPVDQLPAPGQPLVVVLDRDLIDVPLAGLRTAGRYLVEHAPIVELLAPELIFADKPDRPWGPSVVVGDPLGNLPAAASEATVVARALGVTPAIGARAKRAQVTAAAAARVLHVATHSALDDGRAAFVMNDGNVSSYEIVTGHIAPRLAVIATCRSQVDDDPEHSLVAAFLAAGSPGVIGAKRAIDDAEGAALVEAFYGAGGADDPITALAQAQRAAIHKGLPPHAWAAFSFFGTGGWL